METFATGFELALILIIVISLLLIVKQQISVEVVPVRLRRRWKL